MEFKRIGIIHSPYKTLEGTPIQPIGGSEVHGTITLAPEYMDGLKDLDGFSHIILLYHFHKAKKYSLQVKPYIDNEVRGVFATRIPGRPNPIGLSVVRLTRIEGNMVHFQDVDILDGTPLLDIKPYIPITDVKHDTRIGWLEDRAHRMPKAKSNGRVK
jgi:tRNA-Thr(GGU) m(6)t(6)A37 methyltransferase TsaA